MTVTVVLTVVLAVQIIGTLGGMIATLLDKEPGG